MHPWEGMGPENADRMVAAEGEGIHLIDATRFILNETAPRSISATIVPSALCSAVPKSTQLICAR